MAQSTKKGIFAKLFGAKKSCCCNVRIEEIPEDGTPAPGAAGAPPSCCRGAPASHAPGADGKADAGSPGRKPS